MKKMLLWGGDKELKLTLCITAGRFRATNVI